MSENGIEGKLVAYLRDAHAIEDQALVQMLLAPRLARSGGLREAFRLHARETRGHRALVSGRLHAHGASPSRRRDVVMAAGGVGFAAFAALQPDTPGKLAAHAYSYEHLELAGYEIVAHLSRRAGDDASAEVAERIAADEEAMAARIAGMFDESVEASLENRAHPDIGRQLARYLTEAHAIETQARVLLSRARRIGGSELAPAYERHLHQTREHARLVEERLRAHDARRSRLRDAALGIGGVNWSLFFQAQADTPARLAAFAFAFEHLEIAAYEQLRRVASRAGDPDTALVAGRILEDERAAADALRGAFGGLVDAVVAA